MNIENARKVLEHHNSWRRDYDGFFEQTDPRELGQAIDVAIELLRRNEHQRDWEAQPHAKTQKNRVKSGCS